MLPAQQINRSSLCSWLLVTEVVVYCKLYIENKKYDACLRTPHQVCYCRVYIKLRRLRRCHHLRCVHLIQSIATLCPPADILLEHYQRSQGAYNFTMSIHTRSAPTYHLILMSSQPENFTDLMWVLKGIVQYTVM